MGGAAEVASPTAASVKQAEVVVSGGGAASKADTGADRPGLSRPASIMLSDKDIAYVRSGGATHTWSHGKH